MLRLTVTQHLACVNSDAQDIVVFCDFLLPAVRRSPQGMRIEHPSEGLGLALTADADTGHVAIRRPSRRPVASRDPPPEFPYSVCCVSSHC